MVTATDVSVSPINIHPLLPDFKEDDTATIRVLMIETLSISTKAFGKEPGITFSRDIAQLTRVSRDLDRYSPQSKIDTIRMQNVALFAREEIVSRNMKV